MCKWGTLRVINVIHKNNDYFPDGWHEIVVDSCIADYVQEMNARGIITTLCCCGHAEGPGEVFAYAASIPLLDKYGYKWVWSKYADPDNYEFNDRVIIWLPTIEKTWNDDDEVPDTEELKQWRERQQVKNQKMRDERGIKTLPLPDGSLFYGTDAEIAEFVERQALEDE